MRKGVKRMVLAVFLIFSATCYSQGFLKVRGKNIVDGKGNTVLLRGMGLGGWMLQEGYMFGLSQLGQQYRIRQKMEETVGKEKASLFYDSWLQLHTTKKDIQAMKSWGFNSIRLPMHYNLYTLAVDQEPVKGGNTWIEKGFAYTDSLLAWCREYGMYLILDLHATPGGQGHDLPISDRDPSKPSLWQSREAQDKTIALWKQLAKRYANEQWIGGYDIINEPNWSFTDTVEKRGIHEKNNAPLRQLMMEVTAAIREVDTNHIIIIEGNGFGNNYRGVLPAWDNNTVLSFHKYGNFNNEEAIKGFLQLRDQYNLPLWLGESGENSNTWFTEAIKLAESNGIGWAWWQEKKMGINNPLEIRRPAGYDALVAYWLGKGPQPATEDAWATLQSLLQNIRIENNVFHPDVVDAMFRQVGSTNTTPFKKMELARSLIVPATDFDLGPQRFAYYDRDSSSYQYTPGVNTRGNRGGQYRNDGVDIYRQGDVYYVGHIEDGEWLQYSIDVRKAGRYRCVLEYASGDTAGRVSITINEQSAITTDLPAQHNIEGWKEVHVGSMAMKKGLNRIRINIQKGGFRLKSFRLYKD